MTPAAVRYCDWLGFSSTPLIEQIIKFSFHFGERLFLAVLKLAERLVEPKRAPNPKRAKDNRHRIKGTMATEISKRENGQGAPPSAAMRPIEDNRSLSQPRQDVFLDIVVPNRAIRVNEQDIMPS